MKPRILNHEYFGPYNRFCLTTFLTRFGHVEFQVTDSEINDPATNLPQMIVQTTEGPLSARRLALDTIELENEPDWID